MIDNELSRLFDRRSALFLGTATILTSALVLRMLQMQVFSYSKYKRKSENNSFRIQINMPERGKILNAGGTPISRDAPIYKIYIIPEETDDLDSLISMLARELSLKQKKLDKIYTKIKKQKAFQPVLISENSNWKKLAELQAKNISGLHIQSGYTRVYELGEAGAQIFGYVGTAENQNTPFFTNGVTGMEKTFNETLGGTTGQTVFIANAVGRITGEDKDEYIAPIPGKHIKTTIRSDVQKTLQDQLTLNKSGCGVVIELKTGNIVAMVSAPSFDPNNFKSDDADEYLTSLRENFAKPFMNKSLEGLYPPGSTFKIVVALAALEAGALDPAEKIFCPGHWEYGDRKYHCWEQKGHGWVDLTDALKHSCDVYFYQISLRIGIDSIKEMGVRLGLTEKYMNDILPREMIGSIPDRKWKEKHIGAKWVHGDTIISGIGQGFILSNCLELAVMMGRVASNRKIVPRILFDEKTPEFESMGLNNIAHVLKGLERVTQEGGTASGSAINVNGKKMGGKTGTSQVRSISRAERETGVLTNEQLKWNMRNHGLFIGYAPTDKPEYVICTITEHSGSSGTAAHAAAQTMRVVLK